MEMEIQQNNFEIVPRPKRTMLARIYGSIEKNTYHWALAKQWLVKVTIPEALQKHLAYDGNPTRSITCHRHMAGPLLNALQYVIDRGLAEEIKEYNGCFNPRAARGSTRPSTHAYGLALDINARTNGLGRRPTMSAQLVKCFTDAGFVWGGTWSRPDGMHFQYVTEA